MENSLQTGHSSVLRGKKIILGITGSIAAYKSAILIRLLVKLGAEVKVIMTESAQSFISELTLSTLSKNPVNSNIFSKGTWNNHVELGLWADVMVIAPCTALTISKCARGHSDNMLVATYLSAKCPIFFAPAMDLDMWVHGSTNTNLDTLQSFGNKIIPVGHGELASGLVGDGRMAEPEDIVSFIENAFPGKKPLSGKKVMVNAGPTHEAIDPVRYIGNRSSGKMGIAIAEAFANAGAEVNLILGPTHLTSDHNLVNETKVTSAADMYEACMALFQTMDISILAAAVADYTPKAYSEQKVKKTAGDMSISLKRTEDIAKHLGEIKKGHQLLIGFALETEKEKENAFQKLQKKNFDFIVLNSLNEKGAGFQGDTNKVSILFSDNKEENFQLKSKKEVAIDIVHATVKLLQKNDHA